MQTKDKNTEGQSFNGSPSWIAGTPHYARGPSQLGSQPVTELCLRSRGQRDRNSLAEQLETLPFPLHSSDDSDLQTWIILFTRHTIVKVNSQETQTTVKVFFDVYFVIIYLKLLRRDGVRLAADLQDLIVLTSLLYEGDFSFYFLEKSWTSQF